MKLERKIKLKLNSSRCWICKSREKDQEMKIKFKRSHDKTFDFFWKKNSPKSSEKENN